MLQNIIFRKCNASDKLVFKQLMGVYFRDDFKINIDDSRLENICNKVFEATGKGYMCLELIQLENKIIGFVNYQIDTPNSDWNEKEGFGFIREIFISKHYRGKGIGKEVVYYIETALYALGVTNIYLTSDEAGEFWMKCGYHKTNECSKINHDPIYAK